MHSNDPLHGKTLEMILTELVHHFGWEDLGSIIKINCFISNPSINSSLKSSRHPVRLIQNSYLRFCK